MQPSVAQPSVVVRWNEVALNAVRAKSHKVTVVTRSLFMLHEAMFEAWSLYDDAALPVAADPALKRPAAEHTEANKTEALSQAAFTTLLTLFPEYENVSYAFSTLLNDLGYEPYLRGVDTPTAVGYRVARDLLTSRSIDGANAADGFLDTTSAVYPELYKYNPGDDPNRWTPLRLPTGLRLGADGWPVIDDSDLTSYLDQRFMTPQWGGVEGFALASGDQFRPPPPPRVGSSEPYTDALGQTTTNDAAFWEQAAEVLELSAGLSDAQKIRAEYWADGPRSETPPCHWNLLAHGVSLRDENTLDDDVKLYFALNAALFDAGIAVWDAKRFYDYVRPVGAIHRLYEGQQLEAWGGPNIGTRLIDAADWRPYQAFTAMTPAFPEYVSGHSAFSAAAAEVLKLFTGSDAFYNGVTVSETGRFLGEHVAPAGSLRFERGPQTPVILRWPTFSDAAAEAGMSRRYGGIHFQDGDLRGRVLGREVGAQAFEKAKRHWEGVKD
ncbi:hypothetical protein BH24DEI2_BH24DEI2_23120 [soil metagenome]